MADSTVSESSSGAGSAPTKSRPAPGHPKTLDMVLEAIRACDDNPRKGTSVVAIRKWIEDRYPEITKARLRNLMRNALDKGLVLKLIERPKKSEEATTTLSGRYRLGKPPKPVTKKVKKAAATTKAKAKKAKGDGDSGAATAGRGRSVTPKKSSKGKPVPRARARSVSATPRVSKSKKIRSRLSKSHSPLRTPKLIKPKAKTTAAAAKKKTATSPAAAAKAKKAPAKKPAKKSPVAAKTKAKADVATSKTSKAKPSKAAPKDGGKKKK